jgi:DNA-binding NtrC family response regulator
MSLALHRTPATILLVENERCVLEFVSRILQQAGFTVLPAVNAAEALQIEATFAETIDLLLTAFTLPRLSGADLAEELERRRPDLPVMLMSSYPEARSLAASRNWHFSEKPLVASAFLAMIKAVVARQRVLMPC